MKPLYTSKGSRIWYSKYGIGKIIGGKIYIHKDYASKIIPSDILYDAENILKEFDNFQYNCICYNFNTPTIVRFDETKNFNSEREPIVGNIRIVDISKIKIVKCLYSNQIWHHKWLWVDPNYNGFDVKESYNWSKLWLSKLNEPANGSQEKWEQQLKKVGLF